MLPSKLAFVDIETTGMRAFYDRIIEIGILRVEDNKITKKFHSLIDPQSHLPPEITFMTGISARDLENAPTFRQIKDDILETLDDCVFVAHNARFDYGFLKNEFKRLEYTFTKKHFCTVRLSRALYPQFRHHNLDSLIERFGFECVNRHRAFDDAKILFSFYEKILTDFPIEQIAKAINIGLKKPSIPLKLKTDLKKIPEKPGVYIFYGKSSPHTARDTARTLDTLPLYIGKSINLRDRILSHFSSDIHSPLEMKISQQIESIETIETVGEIGALILESQLIKKMLPLYNKKARIKHELIILKKNTNKDGYDYVEIDTFTNSKFEYQNTKQSQNSNSINIKRVDNSNFENLNIISDFEISSSNLDFFETTLGFFRSRKQAKDFLAETAKEFKLCEKLLGLEKTSGACFAYRLGRCKGACIGKEKPINYNLKLILAFASTKIKRWPFPGPILIEETDSHKKELFLINKWCFLGSIKVDTQGYKNENILHNYVFDLDIYKIIKQFITNPQNRNKIRLLKSDEANFINQLNI